VTISGSPRVASRKTGFAIGLVVLSFAIAGIAFPNYPGGVLPYWTAHTAFVVLALLLCRRPISMGLLSLGGFLVLGHWVELMLHLIVGTRFIEPTGRFDNSGPVWDRALILVAAGVAGVCAARLIDLTWRRREFEEWAIVPGWYASKRAAVWVATAIVMVAIIVWNAFDGGFYQIGPAGRHLLLFELHVPLAFWLLAGGGIWLAVLLAWERRARGPLDPLVLLLPAGEGLVTSFTTLGRAIYVIRVAPYVLVALARGGVFRLAPRRRVFAAGAGLVVGLVISLATVSVSRAFIYPTSVPIQPGDSAAALDADPSPSPSRYKLVPGDSVPARALQTQILQIPVLFLQRWIGLEGVLVFAAEPDAGWGLFTAMLTEDPDLRMHGSYQRIAKSRYRFDERFVFMTLPGAIGFAASSGSVVGVFLWLFLLAGVIWGVEYAGVKLTGSAMVGAVATTSLAHLMTQMYSAAVSAINVGEYLCFLLVLGAVARVSFSMPARTGSATAARYNPAARD
jgi:hypothetical protein